MLWWKQYIKHQCGVSCHIWISSKQWFNGDSCCFRNCVMWAVLLHSPGCCFAAESKMIGRHEPPGSVDKVSDSVDRAAVKSFHCGILCWFKCWLHLFPIAIFYPTPILLCSLLLACDLHKIWSKQIEHAPSQSDWVHSGTWGERCRGGLIL